MLFNKKEESDVNILDEFMLGEDEERELRKKIGKYEVYELNDDDRTYAISLIDEIAEQEDGNGGILDDNEYILELFKRLTNLPEKILNPMAFEKIQKKPKKVFTQIGEEITEVMNEFYIEIHNKMDKIKKMPEPMKNEYKKASDRFIKKKKEEKKIELTPEEIEKFKKFQEMEDKEKGMV